MLGWVGDLRTWINVLPTSETGSTSSGAGSRRVDLVSAVCLRPPKRVEAGVVGEEDAHDEAEEPVMLSLSMVGQAETNQSKLVCVATLALRCGVERSEEAKKIRMKRLRNRARFQSTNNEWAQSPEVAQRQCSQVVTASRLGLN